jgi:hypothetical protein
MYHLATLTGRPFFHERSLEAVRNKIASTFSTGRVLELPHLCQTTFFKKEVARGGERTRVFLISFIFSFSPIGRSHSQNSFNESHSFVESVTFDKSLFMSMWARLGRFLEIYGPKF